MHHLIVRRNHRPRLLSALCLLSLTLAGGSGFGSIDQFSGAKTCRRGYRPLVLGFDLRNHVVYDAMYPLLSNPNATLINQAWAGKLSDSC